MTPLRTARLALRPFVPSDAAIIAKLAGDERVAKMLADIALPFDEASAGLWLRPAWGDQRLAIERDSELIGGVSYHVYSGGIGGVGYWLGHAFWGQGYAREAAETIVRNGFVNDRLQMFTSAHFADNPASGRVLSRIGFTEYARGSDWCLARQCKVDCIRYVLQRETMGLRPVRRTWAGWLGFHPLQKNWTRA